MEDSHVEIKYGSMRNTKPTWCLKVYNYNEIIDNCYFNSFYLNETKFSKNSHISFLINLSVSMYPIVKLRNISYLK